MWALGLKKSTCGLWACTLVCSLQCLSELESGEHTEVRALQSSQYARSMHPREPHIISKLAQ